MKVKGGNTMMGSRQIKFGEPRRDCPVSVSSSFLGLTSDIEITEHTQQNNAIVTTGPATQYQATKKPWSCTANVKELAKW